MKKPREQTQPAVIFRDDTLLMPGNCDMLNCMNAAKYAMNNLYLCAEHFIHGCESGEIPEGTFISRVQELL